MATIATGDQITEQTEEVEHLKSRATNLRYRLQADGAAMTDRDFDALAADLTDTNGQLRRATNLLGDMTAGAGDWCGR